MSTQDLEAGDGWDPRFSCFLCCDGKFFTFLFDNILPLELLMVFLQFGRLSQNLLSIHWKYRLWGHLSLLTDPAASCVNKFEHPKPPSRFKMFVRTVMPVMQTALEMQM